MGGEELGDVHVVVETVDKLMLTLSFLVARARKECDNSRYQRS